MTSPIGVALFWFGPLPDWAEQFAERISHTKRVQIVLIGDAAYSMPSVDAPRLRTTYEEFERRASEIAGAEIRKDYRPRRGAELRPLLADVYGHLFSPFQWWGYCDWDTCWGDLDSWLSDDLLARYDMVTSCSYTVNGPFTIFRNTPEIRTLWRQKGLEMVVDPKHRSLDERGMDALCRREMAAGRMRCCYPHGVHTHDRMLGWSRCALMMDSKLYRMDEHGNIGTETKIFHFPGTKRWPL